MTNGPRLVPELVQPAWTTRQGLLEIRVANVAGHWTIALRGELDLSNVEAFERELRSAEAAGDGTVTIDLAGLDFIDSSGLHVILRAHHHSRLGRRLRLVKGKRAVQSVFQLTQTEDRLPFVE